MVRDRVDGWRLAWRFALAGVVVGLLVVTLAQTAFTAGTFDAAQDRLFPAPAPDPRITLVAIDQTSANNLGGYPLVSNAYHAQVINYLMSLHPSVILFDVPLSVETPPSPEPPHDDTNQPLVDALKKAASKIVLVCTADQRPDKLFQVGELVGERTFTNHIVVVGAKVIDAGDVYSQPVFFHHDGSFCPTSRPRCMLDNQNYGYRIQADAMSTILADRYVRTQPDFSQRLSILLLAALAALLVYLLSFRLAVVLTAALLVAYYAFILVLGRFGYLSDPLYAPIAIVLGALFSLGARYVLEERERRKVERIFGHYIDPRVARQLAATRSVNELISKGERRDITVLFMDIRGFTAMSESMRADDVLAVIQDYLDEMSKLILKWDGLIDKYVGDEIMALWNVPLAQTDHALLALRCAYDLVSNAPAVQAKLAARGLPPIAWGIGVNTGPAVVGNMGSQDRLQYTALGDTVNTGARFCSAAPAFNVLVGWPTYQACADYIAVDEMPGLQLKGKSAETFRILKVTAIREDKGSPWVPIPTDAAMSAYTAKRDLFTKQEVFA